VDARRKGRHSLRDAERRVFQDGRHARRIPTVGQRSQRAKDDSTQHQEYEAKDTPRVKTPNGNEVVVIAGATHGVQATIETLSPIVYFDIRLTACNSTETFAVPAGHRGLVYVYRGAGTAGDMVEGQVGLIEDGGELTISVADSEVRLLLVAGVPIGEPVFQRGPFVMASERDLMRAFIDYQKGTLAKPMEGAEERHAQARAAKARQEL
jgi:redox-sensitive bicupin YhaK (pirin superfamily)